MAIQDAMGWKDSHLHMFYMGQHEEITIIGNPIDAEVVKAEQKFNGWETKVARFLKTPGDVATYEYDMGDEWRHEILLEGVFLKEKGVKYPRCIAGERACPPEDCGGTWGFKRLLEALASPKHPEHKELREWIGKKYEPEKFDLKGVQFDNPKARWKTSLEVIEA